MVTPMYRDRPEPREPHGTIRVQLPRRLIAQLNQLSEARRSILNTFTAERSQIVAELLDAALAARLQPVAPSPPGGHRP
jgi:hypothetical protein